MDRAHGAIDGSIGKLNQEREQCAMPTKSRSKNTRSGGGKKSSATAKRRDTTSRSNSSTSTSPSSVSTPRWKQPRTVREFASQVNAVASRVLNGEIDLDVARTFSGLARVVAQSVSSEVTRSRFAKQTPDMSFDANDVLLDEE